MTAGQRRDRNGHARLGARTVVQGSAATGTPPARHIAGKAGAAEAEQSTRYRGRRAGTHLLM